MSVDDMDENGWKGTEMNDTGYKWMGVGKSIKKLGENGWKWMNMD